MKLFDNDPDEQESKINDYDLMVKHVYDDDHELFLLDAFVSDILMSK